ncbi:hypothetical protein [Glycomyces buryatensis]|uniref:Uncharacterized protein n=1 Tax=Glycomyces buryatensis TaxID=2570927 RepID=A0A4S8QF02_9ACTN|nr:hypothetical protein [Glycomyces buryatensis]THV42988.1 hypothetical protein FAB82_03270 [Glycomyces buryatensis]
MGAGDDAGKSFVTSGFTGTGGASAQPPSPSPPVAPGKVEGPLKSITPTEISKRHILSKIKRGTPSDVKNTVILPHVDAEADLAAIKNNQGKWLGGNKYEVNGRIWGLEGSGAIYPVRGDGLVEMNKLQYEALKGLITHEGDRDAMAKDKRFSRYKFHTTDEDWNVAQGVYDQR